MKEKILIVGAYHEMIELCEDCGFEIAGIIDNDYKDEYYGIKIVGTDNDAASLYDEYKDCLVVITPFMPHVRERLYNLYSSIGYKFATLISPLAHVSRFATIGEGTVIQSGVNVAANTTIGRFVKLNTNCNIMHDNTMGDFVTVSPNAVTLGYVNIADRVFLGANSTILPNLSVGEKATVGAGAVVTKNVPEGATVKGVPAK